MPVVAVLHHLEEPFTGHAGDVLRAAGMELDERDVARGAPLPDLDAVDGVLALGGLQSVLDLEPELAAEVELLREAVAREVPVLGVCLGGQLLAHATGGSVRRRERRLVAWPGLEALPAADGDPLFGALPDGAAALHFNEDAIALPPGGVHLVRPVGDDAEGFRVGACAWGTQFHPEVDGAVVDGWYRNWPHALTEAGVREEDARAADARHLPGQPALAQALFGGFARVVAGRAAWRPHAA